MKYRTIILGLFGAAGIAALAAQAQVPGVNSTLNTVFTLAYDNSTSKPTYSATIANVTPAAAANDVCTITGSATTTVRIRRVIFSGRADAVMTDPVGIVKRSAATTGGTSVLMTNVPHDSGSSAATAVTEYYTANGAIGAIVGAVADVYVQFANATTGLGSQYVFKFGELGSPLVLRGAAQQLAVNLGGLTYTSGSIACTFEWTEDSDS